MLQLAGDLPVEKQDQDLLTEVIQVRSTAFLDAPSCLLAVALLSAACGDVDPKASLVTHHLDPDATPQWFTDVTDEVGLDFVYEAGADDQLHLPAVAGGGAALFDFDKDGDLDIYLTNGNQTLSAARAAEGPRNRFYRREADGRYLDVTASSGLGDTGYGMGVAVGDVDNGDLDVYLANYGPDRLYRNEGDGAFVDVTSAASIEVDGWSSSAAFFDFDRDGFLDLYVVRYVDYLPAKTVLGARRTTRLLWTQVLPADPRHPTPQPDRWNLQRRQRGRRNRLNHRRRLGAGLPRHRRRRLARHLRRQRRLSQPAVDQPGRGRVR